MIETNDFRPIKSRHHQNGFTLIELMIALLIGMILSIGLLQAYMTARQANRLALASARMLEDGRLSMEFTTQRLRQGVVAPSSDSDTLIFVNDNDMDCFGAELTGVKTIHTFSYNNNNLGYSCELEGSTKQVDNQPLIGLGSESGLDSDMVENMRFLYGIDEGGDGSVNNYSASYALDTIAVRWCLQLVSSEANLLPSVSNTTGCDGNPKIDQRLRRVLWQTAYLRNAAP